MKDVEKTVPKKSEEEMLHDQRLEIADSRRKLGKKLDTIEFKQTREEREMENLAKTFMNKTSKKFYTKINRKKKGKNSYWERMEQRRLKHEQKQE